MSDSNTGASLEQDLGKAKDAAPASAPTTISLFDVLDEGDDLCFGLTSVALPDKPTAVPLSKAELVPSADHHIGDTVTFKKPHETVSKDESVQKKEIAVPKSVQPVVEEWAVMVNVNKPIPDFKQRIPVMAREWKFELDIFQKQAILRVENKDHVLVAAHTSAGKTVVAEYAIALCARHRTKAIYTSPIKALSNQKFRDFRDIFDSVGLVTGDVQIKPEADCVVMTTEILRSMLYNGSDVIRELEWVIFDEVHYINDTERGVVWEEVLIMLPPHVHIVMLSATVPNTKEFAEWVGRTKQKKVYVVSTTHRPIPLKHFLYTGNSNKTSNELFLVLDEKMEFIMSGYNKALEAKKQRASKMSQSYGAKGCRQNANPQQDKNIWLSVIHMLKKEEKMPAIAFVFSRNRIDELTDRLQSVDLVTSNEKSQIHVFFEQCISRLKEPDRLIPQVKQVGDLLHRGIGIHHSGILPLLKEIVEMLFQRGLVKILFATETFAMGVNMPARTVVFDTLRKHDGTAMRDLLAGEYIQMAGRAGRRGLDDAGTVILLCKGDVPEVSDIHRMMLGKTTQLASQFRLTYSMILNLLRVEQMRVEDMIKRSFSEFNNQKEAPQHAARLRELEPVMKSLPSVVDSSGDLQEYFNSCREYFQLHDLINEKIYAQHLGSKVLTPGRIIVIDTKSHYNVPGIILQMKDRNIKVLILCEKVSSDDKKLADDWNVVPRPVLARPLFLPEGQCSHEVVNITVKDIVDVSTKVLKVNADRIVDDVKKREQPRFRNDPPGPSVETATQELLRIVESTSTGLASFDPVCDLHIQDLDLVTDVRRFQYLAKNLPTFKCINDPNFQEKFTQLRKNTQIQEEYQLLKHKLSEESLMLLPEYQQRVEVLRHLSYIDKGGLIQRKGRVACELRTAAGHEVLVTELMFDNAFANLEPAELAAVLSCIVFKVSRCSEPNLTPVLAECRDRVLKMAENVVTLEKECGIHVAVDDYLESLNFGLLEVVHEWAHDKPFVEIKELTDVQEGLIVRCIQRLDEALQDVAKAACTIGNLTLQQRAEAASAAIKRDIVFAASLYTQ